MDLWKSPFGRPGEKPWITGTLRSLLPTAFLPFSTGSTGSTTTTICCGKVSISYQGLPTQFRNEPKFSQEFKIPGLREGLKSEFVKNVLIEIGSNDTKRDMVSIDGSYSFDDVDDGKYLLFSEYNNKFIEGFWLEPVEVSNGDHFDLNGNTFASLPFIKYLGAQTDVVCLSCGKSAFGKSMLSKSELEGGQAKSVQKETDMKNEIADSIRGLKNTMKSLQYIY